MTTIGLSYSLVKRSTKCAPALGNGRRPYPLETMLRIHCMQHWYNLSDGAMEDFLNYYGKNKLRQLKMANK